MGTLTTTAHVTRALLALEDLDINDHFNYALTPTIMGGQTSWEKNEVSSPWVDGEFIVSQRKRNVQEQIIIDVYGATQSLLQVNVATLIEAFTQETYGLTFDINGAVKYYKCFSADYSISWDRTRVSGLTVPVTFSVPRLPNPLVGV